MSALEFGFLVLAGIGAGLTGSIAGLASLVSYPALLATGIPPVTANVTNTVALVLNAVGSVSASRPELRGQGRRLRPLLIAAVLGGAAGMALLLLTPTEAFERIVPWLIATASAAILVQRPPRELAAEGARRPVRDPRWLPLGTFAVAIYGGYFGAAAGELDAHQRVRALHRDQYGAAGFGELQVTGHARKGSASGDLPGVSVDQDQLVGFAGRDGHGSGVGVDDDSFGCGAHRHLSARGRLGRRRSRLRFGR